MRRLQRWAQEAEWLSARVDRWLTACQGYSKLYSSDQGNTPRKNPIKKCAQRIQNNINRATRADSGRTTDRCSARTPRPVPAPCTTPLSRSKPVSLSPNEIVFEKCKPRRRHTTSEAEPDAESSGNGVPALDIVYYPFREENCVVCRQTGSALSTLTPVPCPCPRADCTPSFTPTAQQEAAGATGALFFRSMPLGKPRQHHVINVSQDFIEVTALRGAPAPHTSGSPLRPPSDDSFNPRQACELSETHLPGDEDDDPEERTIFSRPCVVEQVIYSRQQREGKQPARYRSRGKFSSVMYETQRAFEEAFQVEGELQPPPRPPLGMPVKESIPRARSLHGPPERMGLREVDPPHTNLHSFLSFRRRSRTQKGPRPGPRQGSAWGVERCSGRPEKRVVVGDRGVHGPVWPRVILTYDRGVSPCQAPFPRSGTSLMHPQLV